MTRTVSGEQARIISRSCRPEIEGIRWSAITTRAFFSRTQVIASSGLSVVSTWYGSFRNSLRSDARMAGSSSTQTTTRSSVSIPTSLRRCLGIQLKRQSDDELGAPSEPAMDLDAPAVGPDDLVRHVKAEAGALAHRLRGEERKKELRAVLLG